MGAEQRPGQVRPFGRPAFQKFDAGLPGNNGVLGSGTGERRGSGQPFSLDRPIDLVGNIRGLIQQEQAKGNPYFNAAWFLRNEMNAISLFVVRPGERVKGKFYYALRAAWDLVAYDELRDHRDSVYTDIRGCIQVFGSNTLTLSTLGVTLLDAMAEATGIQHTPGQDTFDLSLFSSTEAMARIKRGQVPEGYQYTVPTSEEVKRAITKSVDSK